MTGFDINEDLKERCILLGASSCYTEFRPDGDLVCKNPCWYNKIVLSSSLYHTLVIVLCGLIDDYLEELESLGLEVPITDVQSSKKEKYIHYWIVCDKKNFLEKNLLSDK